MPKKLPPARGLTRKERREFREAGIDPSFIDFKNPDKPVNVQELNEKIINWMSEKIYKINGPEYDDVQYNEFKNLCDLTYQITYGTQSDIKNSSASGGGTLTDAENTVQIAES